MYTTNELEKLEKADLIAIVLKLSEKIAELSARIAELEVRLHQNSTNSSKPPSSDGLAKPASRSLREKSGRKPGGQKGHKGHGLKIVGEPDKIVIVAPDVCPECGTALESIPFSQYDTRYKYDVVIKIKLVKYVLQSAKCPNCGSIVRTAAPPGCEGTLNYGETIRSLSAMLTNYANVSINKTHKIMNDLLGLPISGGTIKAINAEFAGKANDILSEIKEHLRGSPVLHLDETGLRVNGKTQWIHVASNSEYTLTTVHRKRGKDGTDSGGVMAEYEGTVVHDCWKPYFGYDKCVHALCNAHLLRELNALIEQKQEWASEMKMLLLEMKEVVEGYKNSDKTELSRYFRKKFKGRYESILEAGRAENPLREGVKRSKAENLLKRLEERREEVCRFSEDFEVPFDNNQAERDIRNVKVKGKVSGSFRTEEGAEDYAKTASFIGTVVKQCGSVLKNISSLFAGKIPSFASTTE
jgi:rRNA maturation protein Nop10